MLGININCICLEFIFTIFYHNTAYQQFSFHLFLSYSQQRFHDYTNARLSAYALTQLALILQNLFQIDIYILHGISQWNGIKSMLPPLCSNNIWYVYEI